MFTTLYKTLSKVSKSCAIARAITRRLLDAEVYVQSQVVHAGFIVTKWQQDESFSKKFGFLPSFIISIIFHIHP
jgi:hypothetical protein